MFHAPASETIAGARNCIAVPDLPFCARTSTPTAAPRSTRNTCDFMAGQQFAACLADHRAHRFRNLPRTSARVPCAPQVMRRDQRMRRERALLRGQAIVGPLRRDHRAKARIAKASFEIRSRPAERQTRRQPVDARDQPAQRRWRRHGHEAPRAPARRGFEVAQIAVHVGAFVRKSLHQRAPEILRPLQARTSKSGYAKTS